MRLDLTEPERSLLTAALDAYTAELRKACEEDQGDPNGAPGTVGHTLQRDLRSLRDKVTGTRVVDHVELHSIALTTNPLPHLVDDRMTVGDWPDAPEVSR